MVGSDIDMKAEWAAYFAWREATSAKAEAKEATRIWWHQKILDAELPATGVKKSFAVD